MIAVERLAPASFEKEKHALAEVLHDAVQSGAGVSFMLPFTVEEALSFWEGQAADVASGEKIILAAAVDGRTEGTVTVIPAWAPNQPHRVEIAKLLVHRRARKQGVGRALMLAAEDETRAMGRWLMTLDTVPGDNGERLYRALGWQPAARIPGFAYRPNGELDDTLFMWKRLDG